MAKLFLDVTPLRESPPFRRLWMGQSLAAVGAQLTTMAVALEIFDLTHDSFMVGLVGVFALVPLVIMGLYGGSIIDNHDRRIVALVAAIVQWSATLGLAFGAWFHLENVWFLYAMVFIQYGANAVNAPARTSIIPRIVDRKLLPAANALNSTTWTSAMMVGPLIGAWLVAMFGYKVTYSVDALTFTAALYAIFKLPAVLPIRSDQKAPLRGWASVIDGFRFLATKKNLRMTFYLDLAAMVLAFPVALFPAIAETMIGGGKMTTGWLTSFIAMGMVVTLILSGPLGRVRRQGLAVTVTVIGWGASIAGFGGVLVLVGATNPESVIWWAFAASGVFLFLAGAFDAVSSVFRNVILQAAVPDELRGRLQGIFTVTVAGGPNLGRTVSGGLARGLGAVSAVPLGLTALIGGGLCVLSATWLSKSTPSFNQYDSENPVP
ncbi:MAG: MFS transporter [Propionibacteriaceae bacterium]|nr:MFS transporter [Propionibacteriaceae bacterium]